VRRYYDRRAPEYDDWYFGEGRFSDVERPGFDEELGALAQALARLPAARVLDVACGTGFLTRYLRGDVVGLDQSERMLAEARRRHAGATYVLGDALRLPFPDSSFDRVVSAHFYGHLRPRERRSFLREALRVAPRLVVVDSALREGVPREETQERVLSDGSRWRVYKRYFDPAALAEELGSGRVLYAGRWFVAAASGAT
jgi:ubiquinone/menaquinone biosynthesis C-methylase UbiE